MFFSRLLSMIWRPRRPRQPERDVWPETRMFEAEKAMFRVSQKQYNNLIQNLMESPNAHLNQLSMKYHSEAFNIIYIGCTRIHDYYELAEQRHALNQILERIHEEASHVN